MTCVASNFGHACGGQMADLVYRQVSVDMYFIDWEKSRGLVSGPVGNVLPHPNVHTPDFRVSKCVYLLQLMKSGGQFKPGEPQDLSTTNK